jgi:CRP-like cAMP-binding protein
LILSADAAEKSDKKPVISVNREDLAGFAATTKETLVRMLRIMKDNKIIATKGTKIQVLKRDELLKEISAL